MQFNITHLTGSRAGSTQQLQGSVITVGRDPTNTLAFNPQIDDKVSGFHANLTVQGDQVILTDLGSSNGTYFNGQKISGPVALVPGCNVQFGENGPIVSLSYGAVAATPAAGGAAAGGAAAGGAAAPGAAAPGATAGGATAGGAAAPGGAGGTAPTAEIPAASDPGAPAPPAAGAAPPPGGPPPADAAPPPPKVDIPKGPSKIKTCLIPAGCMAVIGCLALLVCLYAMRDSIPPGMMRYVEKIPVVGPKIKKARSAARKVKSKTNQAERMKNKVSGGKKKKKASDEDESDGDDESGEEKKDE